MVEVSDKIKKVLIIGINKSCYTGQYYESKSN